MGVGLGLACDWDQILQILREWEEVPLILKMSFGIGQDWNYFCGSGKMWESMSTLMSRLSKAK